MYKGSLGESQLIPRNRGSLGESQLIPRNGHMVPRRVCKVAPSIKHGLQGQSGPLRQPMRARATVPPVSCPHKQTLRVRFSEGFYLLDKPCESASRESSAPYEVCSSRPRRHLASPLFWASRDQPEQLVQNYWRFIGESDQGSSGLRIGSGAMLDTGIGYGRGTRPIVILEW